MVRTGRRRSLPSHGKRRVRCRETSGEQTEDDSVDEIFCLKATRTNASANDTPGDDLDKISQRSLLEKGRDLMKDIRTRCRQIMDEVRDILESSTKHERMLAFVSFVALTFIFIFFILISRSTRTAKQKGSRNINAYREGTTLKKMKDIALVGDDAQEPSDFPSASPSLVTTILFSTTSPSSLRGSSSPSATPSSLISQSPSQGTILMDELATATIRMNAGVDQSFVDVSGNRWLSDVLFRSSTISVRMSELDVCQSNQTTLPADVDPEIFCQGVATTGTYRFFITNNVYQVNMYLIAEKNFTSFDVRAEDILVHRSFPVEEGPKQAFVVSFRIRVSDGELNVEIANGLALLAGIIVEKVHGSRLPPIGTDLSYIPGLLTVESMGLVLSEGLSARLLAQSGQPVEFIDGTTSEHRLFHLQPDAAATFSTEDGWIYVSNSEAKPEHANGEPFPGGVGALRFDMEGNVVDYQMILNGTRANCGGGRTPWGSWISGEEYAPNGRIWQVDPEGKRPAERITMGEVNSGLFESFAYDVRNETAPRFFMTQDADAGVLRRFTPNDPNWSEPWEMLLGDGSLDYLIVEPDFVGAHRGTFRWESNHTKAPENAMEHFPHSEGIDVQQDTLYFISKEFKTMFMLNLDSFEYSNYTTKNGLFNGQPDQIETVFEDGSEDGDDLTYFTEDGGQKAGVHARTKQGNHLTILESEEYFDETTGLSFSPDGMFMYIAYQDNGLLFEIRRNDGYPFYSKALGRKYHSVAP